MKPPIPKYKLLIVICFNDKYFLVPKKSQRNGFNSLTCGYKNAQTCIIFMLLKNKKKLFPKIRKKNWISNGVYFKAFDII